MKCQTKKCKAAKLRTLRTTYMGDHLLELEHMVRVRSCPLCDRRYETVELFRPGYMEQVRSLKDQIRLANREKDEAENDNRQTLEAIDQFLNRSPLIAEIKTAADKKAASRPRTKQHI